MPEGKRAVGFRISPCGYKLVYNCIYITCEDGTEVVVSEELAEEMFKSWQEI